MKTEKFNELGEALGGTGWKSWLARKTSWSRRQIIRISQGAPVPEGLAEEINALAAKQRKALKL